MLIKNSKFLFRVAAKFNNFRFLRVAMFNTNFIFFFCKDPLFSFFFTVNFGFSNGARVGWELEYSFH